VKVTDNGTLGTPLAPLPAPLFPIMLMSIVSGWEPFCAFWVSSPKATVSGSAPALADTETS